MTANLTSQELSRLANSLYPLLCSVSWVLLIKVCLSMSSELSDLSEELTKVVAILLWYPVVGRLNIFMLTQLSSLLHLSMLSIKKLEPLYNLVCPCRAQQLHAGLQLDHDT